MPEQDTQKSFESWKLSQSDAEKYIQALLDITAETAETDEAHGIVYVYAQRLQEVLLEASRGDEQQKRDASLVSMIPEEAIALFLQTPTDEANKEEATWILGLLAIAARQMDGMDYYTVEQLKAFFHEQKEAPVSTDLLVNTLRQAALGQDLAAYARVVAPFFYQTHVQRQVTFSWEGAFMRSLCLHLLWQAFPLLDKQSQEVLLKYFCYEAEVFGVNVHGAILKTLEESAGVTDYVRNLQFFSAVAMSNQEKVRKNMTTEDRVRMLTLLGTPPPAVGTQPAVQNHNQSLSMQVFGIYGDAPEARRYADPIIKTLMLFEKIHTDGFGLYNNEPAPDESEVFSRELVQLFIYFFSKTQWFHIVEYYKKTKPLVPLRTFLYELARDFKLDSEARVQHVLEFGAYLKSSSLLGQDEDLVAFDEEAGLFVWHTDFYFIESKAE